MVSDPETALPGTGNEASVTRSQLVEDFFRLLFPQSFQLVVPLKDHKVRHCVLTDQMTWFWHKCMLQMKSLCALQEVDQLLQNWDRTVKALEVAEAEFEGTNCEVRPTHRLGYFGWCGERVDTINALAKRVQQLEGKILDARERALQVVHHSGFMLPCTSAASMNASASVHM